MTDDAPHIPPTVIAFDSTEELFAYMSRAEEAANAATTEAQAKIRDATETVYAFRISLGIAIFGEVLSLAESQAAEKKLYNLDKAEDREEYEYTANQLADSRQRGYVFGKWFSVVEPTGELGSAHVSSLTQIDKALFDHAKTRQWSY